MTGNELAAVTPVAGDRTVEQAIVRALRDLITDGRLEPGLRLRYRDLAARFGVSVTPVRIALRDLAKEGLVEIAPHARARVTPLSIEELEEVYSARAGLEGLLAKRGAERMTDEALAPMRKRLGELESIADTRNRRRYLHAIWAYRLLCYEQAGRPRLLETVSLLVRRSARYNTLSLDEQRRFEESLVFQRRFLDASERRDGAAAERVMREAMDWGRDYLTVKYAALMVADEAEP
jgi:DNA-binding GntR family transcriptional regulator